MKIKNVLGITSIVSVMALGVAFAVSPREAAVVKATSPYSIADNSFEAAFLESYNSTGDNGFYKDQPLGKLSLGGTLLDESKTDLQANYTTSFRSGITETTSTALQWTFSGVRVKDYGNTEPKTVTARLQTNSSTANVLDTSVYPADGDFNKVGLLTKGSDSDQNVSRVSVLMTSDYIDEVNDFSFYWRSVYARKLSICYKIEGQDWVRLSSYNTVSSNGGNYTGTRGWDAYGYTTFNLSGWASHELKGAKAKLAIAITNIGSDDGNIVLSAVLINSKYAAVRYLNTLSYQNHICSDNDYEEGKAHKKYYYNLNNSSANGTHNQDMFKLATERVSADELADYEIFGEETSERNALSFYNYLVSSISGLGDVKSPSSVKFFNGIASFENGDTLLIIISVSAVSFATLGFVLFKKSKKQK